MTGYVYILQCNDGSYYTGSTKNIEMRLRQHENGQGANHTRKHQPVKLVFVEQFERIDEAFAREKQIQGWSRKKKEALIDGDFNRLHTLSQCQNTSHHSGFDSAGFDSAQPTSSSQSEPTNHSRSRVAERSRSGVAERSRSKVEGCSLSEVEGRDHS